MNVNIVEMSQFVLVDSARSITAPDASSLLIREFGLGTCLSGQPSAPSKILPSLGDHVVVVGLGIAQEQVRQFTAPPNVAVMEHVQVAGVRPVSQLPSESMGIDVPILVLQGSIAVGAYRSTPQATARGVRGQDAIPKRTRGSHLGIAVAALRAETAGGTNGGSRKGRTARLTSKLYWHRSIVRQMPAKCQHSASRRENATFQR